MKGGPSYLSMNHRRATVGGTVGDVDVWVTVEVPRLLGSRNQEDVPVRILEESARRPVFARPHWGQGAPRDAYDVTVLYPDLDRWQAAREQFGAHERFMPAWLRPLLLD